MRVLAAILLASVVGVPTQGAAQSIQDLLQGRWTCSQDVRSRGTVVATYTATRDYSGNRVSGVGGLVGTSPLNDQSFESVASYTARVRVRGDRVYETGHRIKRVSDLLNGQEAFVPRASTSFAESHIPEPFSGGPGFQGCEYRGLDQGVRRQQLSMRPLLTRPISRTAALRP